MTANKALLAKHGVELAALAERRGVSLNFEAAVAGGIPIMKTLREALAGNQVKRVYGIINGTCNYILTRMEREKLARLRDLPQGFGGTSVMLARPIRRSMSAGLRHGAQVALLTSLAFGSGDQR